MLKQTVIFDNVDNVKVSKDLYFNISQTELSEQELLSNGQFLKDIEAIKEATTIYEVYPMMQRFVKLGYGVRSPEGDFYKSAADTERFLSSLAYNQLMEDIFFVNPGENGTNFSNFVNGMLPADLAAKVQAQMAQSGFRPGANTERPVPPVQSVPETVPATPVAPVQAEVPPVVVQQQIAPGESPIEQISTPRTDLLGS